MRYSLLRQYLLPATLLVASCSSQKTATPVVDLVVDSNRSGLLEMSDPSEDANEDTWDEKHGAIFLANLDDDDKDGKADNADDKVNGAADIQDLSPIHLRAWPDAPKDATAVLAVDAASAGAVRIFRVVGDPKDPASYHPAGDPTAIVLGQADLAAGADFALEGLTFVTSTADTAWKGYVDLKLTVTLGKERIKDPALLGDTVRLRVAPLLLQHNLARTENIYYTDAGKDNQGLADGINAAAQAAGGVTVSPMNTEKLKVDFDQWTQDFFDIGYTSKPGPDGKPIGMKVAIRSAQPDRSAGKVVTKYFLGPDWAAIQLWQDDTQNDHGYSMNSFGNWDVIPPYTKGAEKYPLGRNYWGKTDDPSESPDPVFQDFYRAQAVQPVFNVNTSWLGVGHVDEFTSWVKTNTPRGWGMLLAAPKNARQMLMDLDGAGHGDQVMFDGLENIDWQSYKYVPAKIAVRSVLSDPDLMAASQTAQSYSDSEGGKLQQEIGLDNNEVTLMPFLYEESYGGALAFQPGTVNLLHIDGNVVIPDPFGPLVDNADPFKEDIKQRLGALGLNVIFADDWDMYHIEAGEVHCGSNVSRDMTVAWWESGR